MLLLLSLFQVRIAVLTCHEVLWLLERHDKDLNTIYISDPILAASKGPEEPTVLLAMAWAQHKALLQLSEPLPPPGAEAHDSHHRVGLTGSSDPGNDSNPQCYAHSVGPPPASDGSSPLSKKAWPDDNLYSSQVSSDPADARLQQLQQQQQQQQPLETVPMHQQLKLLAKQAFALPVVPCIALGLHQGTEVLGQGCTAAVFKGSVGGRDAAIKVSAWQVPAMLREAAMYNYARQLQGVVIPELLAIGRLAPAYKGLSFLAVSFVPGKRLSAMKITPDVSAAAVSAVQRLHSCGVVHGDLTLDNMLLLHQQPSSSSSSSTGMQQQMQVMLIDLGSARLASSHECDQELQRFQRKLTAHTSASTRFSMP